MKLYKNHPIIILLILSTPFIFFGTFQILGNREREKFYKNKINSTIISSSDLEKKVVEYYLPNNLEIDVTVVDTIDINVGDSIAKKANSWYYNVFKRNKNNQFEYFEKYKLKN